MKVKIFLTFFFQILLTFAVFGQIVPPCGNDYGNSGNETNMRYQMRYGTIPDAVAAINQAKSTRSIELGCPQTELFY